MPSERSAYHKIRWILNAARSKSSSTLRELAHEVEKSGAEIFMTRQYVVATDAYETTMSHRVVRRTIAMCYYLGLILETGRLTQRGTDALRGTRFDERVAEAVMEKLETFGISPKELNSTIGRGFQQQHPQLPTAKYLWAETGPKGSYSRFNRLLTLLADCGHATSSQRKLYLRIGRMG